MKTVTTLMAVAILFLAASCSKSELQTGPGSGNGTPNGTPVSLNLATVAPLAATAFSNVPASKSATELPSGTVDAQIHDLWALQYDAAGKLVGTPYYTTEIPAGVAGGTGIDYTYNGLSVNLTSSGTATHTVVFMANTHNGTLFTVDNDVTTLDKLHARVQSIGTEYKPTEAGGILMLGVYTGVVKSGTPIAGVKMDRLVAKVNLLYKSSISGFTVTGVRMRNVAQNIYYTPVRGGIFPAKNTTVGSESHFDYPAEDLAKAGTDGEYKTFTWYLPENHRGVNAAVTAVGDRTLDKTDGAATYIEITGILRDGDRARKATYNILLGNTDTGNGGALGNFNVERNTAYAVTVDLKGLNVGDHRLTVEEFDMSNSAMILPATTAGVARDSVVFDIRKCLNNGFTTQAQLNAMLGENSTLTADVLWQDGDVINTADISLNKTDGLLTVRSSKAADGNAIIALYPDAQKTQGSVLWSWHVWVTEYDPDAAGFETRAANAAINVLGGQVHTYGTEFQRTNGMSRVIMDRNLGATKTYYAPPAANDATADQAFGMMYQWGRKDPFPRANGSTIDATMGDATTIPIYGPTGTKLDDEVTDIAGTGCRKMNITGAGILSGTNTLAYAVKNPLAFIYNAATPFDWYTTVADNQNNALWGDKAAKSAYDPCPKGWRVPPTGTWDDLRDLAYAAPLWYYINVSSMNCN